MAKQDHSVATYSTLNADEIKLLDAEKKYMEEIFKVLDSPQFKSKLSSMFIELDRHKAKIISDYNGISIINTPAERLVTHCIYEEFFKQKTLGKSIYRTLDFYPMPECGDLGIVLDEVVLSIEVKTICITSNSSDLGYLPFRRNQTSFENICDYSNCDPTTGYRPQFRIKGNIEQFVGTKPVLTYVIELVYEFDKNNPLTSSCRLFRGPRRDGISTINLFCIPNGYLGRLFDGNIFQNVKAYTYYPDEGYSEIIKLDTATYPNKSSCLANLMSTYAFIRANYGKVNASWVEANVSDYVVFLDTANPGAEFHESSGKLWILAEKKDSAGIMRPIIGNVKAPNGCRIDWKNNLKERYDSSNVRWDGVKHITV